MTDICNPVLVSILATGGREVNYFYINAYTSKNALSERSGFNQN